MADDAAKAGEPSCTWQRAIELNRRIDDAVATIERAVWRDQPQAPAQPPHQSHRPPPPPPVRAGAPFPTATSAPAPIPAPMPAKPVLWPAALAGLRRDEPSQHAAPQPADEAPSVPPLRSSWPLSPVGTASAGPIATTGQGGDLAAIEAELTAALDALRLRREALADAGALVFPIPWSATPRPLFVRDEASGAWRPNPVSDDEIRDFIQPHWRALYKRADAAETAVAAIQEDYRKANPLRRIGVLRRALREAQRAAAETAQAKETADLLWAGEAMRQRFEHDRTRAALAFEQAMKAAEGVTRLDADIAGMEAERALVVALRQVGVSTVVRRGDETRMQALERALSEAARVEEEGAPEAVAEETGGTSDGHDGTDPEGTATAGRELTVA